MENTTDTKQVRKDDIQREICELMNRLSANSSDIGDWKISKIYEYRMQNKADPYDADALFAERQAVRDRINELQIEAASLDEEDSTPVE